MRSCSMALQLLSVCVGSYLSGAVVYATTRITAAYSECCAVLRCACPLVLPCSHPDPSARSGWHGLGWIGWIGFGCLLGAKGVGIGMSCTGALDGKGPLPCAPDLTSAAPPPPAPRPAGPTGQGWLPKDLNAGRLDLFFVFLGALMAANLLLFLWVRAQAPPACPPCWPSRLGLLAAPLPHSSLLCPPPPPVLLLLLRRRERFASTGARHDSRAGMTPAPCVLCRPAP